MFGLGLILILAVMGGIIAFLGDKLGSKIGKKKMSLFGLRPYHTSVLITIVTGIAVAAATMGALTLVSEDVRTALFGMNRLKSEIAALNSDKQAVEAELSGQNAKVKALDEEIKVSSSALADANRQKVISQKQLKEVQGRYREAEAGLAATKEQVSSLAASRDKLQGEVHGLEEATRKLREGLIAIREGDVVFRSGEMLYAGVLRGGLAAKENKEQMQSFLMAANHYVLERMQAKSDVQALWLPDKMVNEALAALAESKGNIYVRVSAAANILAGEMVISKIEMAPNRKIFAAGTTILTQKINVRVDSQQPEAALLAFLRDVNKTAVGAGVVPDPLTGKVGAVEAKEMETVSANIRKLGGRVEVIGRAKRDIFVSGPVLLDVEVKSYE